MEMPEAKIKASIAKTKAWTRFAGQFLNTDRNQFVVQVEFDEKHNVKAEIFFKDSPTSFQSVFGFHRKFWSK